MKLDFSYLVSGNVAAVKHLKAGEEVTISLPEASSVSYQQDLITKHQQTSTSVKLKPQQTSKVVISNQKLTLTLTLIVKNSNQLIEQFRRDYNLLDKPEVKVRLRKIKTGEVLIIDVPHLQIDVYNEQLPGKYQEIPLEINAIIQ